MFLDGTTVPRQTTCKYLGVTAPADAKTQRSISSRLQHGWNTYHTLKCFYRRSGARLKWKVQTMQAIINEQALYGLQEVHVYPNQHGQLLNIQDRTLRKIVKIDAPYKSRVTYEALLEEARKHVPKLKCISQQHLESRHKLLEPILRRQPGEIDLCCFFNPGGAVQQPEPRRVGRPRFTWLGKPVKHYCSSLLAAPQHTRQNDAITWLKGQVQH